LKRVSTKYPNNNDPSQEVTITYAKDSSVE